MVFFYSSLSGLWQSESLPVTTWVALMAELGQASHEIPSLLPRPLEHEQSTSCMEGEFLCEAKGLIKQCRPPTLLPLHKQDKLHLPRSFGRQLPVLPGRVIFPGVQSLQEAPRHWAKEAPPLSKDNTDLKKQDSFMAVGPPPHLPLLSWLLI